MITKEINFDDEELKEALEKYFKLKKGSITSYYIRSLFGDGHSLTYSV